MPNLDFLMELEVAARKNHRDDILSTNVHDRIRFRDRFLNVSYTNQSGEPLSPSEYEQFLLLKKRENERRYAHLNMDRFVTKRQHLRVNTDRTKEASFRMSPSTLGAMMMILGEVTWNDDNLLLSEQGRPMRVKDFQTLFGGKSRSTVMRILKDLKEVGFLFSDGETLSTSYYVNPDFHVMGKMAKKENFVRLYNEEVRKLTKEIRTLDGRPRRISPDALGFFYKLMPFIHISMNVVCHNPNETNREHLHLATESDLHELTGSDRKTVKKYMTELILFGVVAILEIYDGRSIIPNPKYLYRGNDLASYESIIEAMERQDQTLYREDS